MWLTATWTLRTACFGAVDPSWVLGAQEHDRKEPRNEVLPGGTLPALVFQKLLGPFYVTPWGLWHVRGGALALVSHCPPPRLGWKALCLSTRSHPVFLRFSVPLSLSRTFVVSRTEVLAAGSPGNSACFLFITLIALMALTPGSLAARAALCVHSALPHFLPTLKL